MSWSTDEWETVCLLIDQGWPGDFSDAQAAAWRVFLDDYDAQTVLAALKGLVAQGGAFRPSVAEVVAQICRDSSRPTLDEALTLIRRALRAGRRPLVGDFATEAAMLGAREQMVRDAAASMHSDVASFVCRCSDLARLEADIAELSDEQWGSVRRREFEARWKHHCETWDGRKVTAIASGRRGELAVFDPLAALSPPLRRQIGSGSGM